ncbi:Isoamylase 2, chloroplastic [Linum grandiflorum]
MRTLSPSLPICSPAKLNSLSHCAISGNGSFQIRGIGVRRSEFGGSNVLLRKLNLGVANANSRPSFREIVTPPPPSVEVEEELKKSTYLFRTEVGGSLKVSVSKKKDKYVVYLEVSSLELGISDCEVMLVWRICRSDETTAMEETSTLMQTAGGFSGELEFETKQSPFYLSFVLKSMEDEIRSHRKTRFCVPVGFDRGSPAPLGISFSADGSSVNFAFFSRNAHRVVLCLYCDDASADNKPAVELDLDSYVNKTGNIWHASFEDVSRFRSYGFRCRSEGQVLLDPYAKVTGSSFLQNKYLGRLCKEPDFDWTGDVRPNLPLEKLVVYRLNVKRFTQHRSSQLSSDDVLGSFAGVAEKVKHFKDLGVNAVLLEPVFPFDEHKGPYFPCHFFSPSNLSSGDSISAISSMKEMVKTLHANGIEVFMEVVFSHTAESQALQGIDDSSYYYTDSVLNCNYPVVNTLILDSLKHWVTEFHIDGFCFMNAASLVIGFNGESLSRPPLIESIAFEPLLSKTKIIADFYDPKEMLVKETRFPHWKRWAEMNTKFCYDVRNFLKGGGHLSCLATRLCGSGDVFASGRGPSHGFNFIARNSGLSLVDLVSFSSDNELSWNCGEEGPTGKTLVLERRLKQIRNYIFILFVSLGVPVLNMGDECGQSSGGSTSYTHRKPLDWNAFKTGFGTQTTGFISFLSELRARRSDLLQKGNFLDEKNIEWYGNDQCPPKWDDPSSKFLAMGLKTNTNKPADADADGKGDLFMAFNAGRKSEDVALPVIPEGMKWHRLVDTALTYPGFFSDAGELADEDVEGSVVYEMRSHSCVLFEARSSLLP